MRRASYLAPTRQTTHQLPFQVEALAAAVEAAVFAYVCDNGRHDEKTLSASSLGYGQADKRILILQLVGAHGSIAGGAGGGVS